MKEIKFRAWDRERKRMLYDVVFAIHKNLIAVADQNCCGIGQNGYFTVIFQNSLPRDQIVLMQYTGLKDKNGKEIYEGDIIVDSFNHYEKGKVAENTAEFWWEVIEYGLEDAELEVIGNIYENPELLKDEK
jgi:uncharacterized phage protein (TIGR01671 family)